MAQHTLKCWSNAFDAIADGRKTFEWRKDDRGFEVGDELFLKRWDPVYLGGSGRYVDYNDKSTQNTMRVRVKYILRGLFGIPEGYCVMAITPDIYETVTEIKEPLREELDRDEEEWADIENAIHEAGFDSEANPADVIRGLKAQLDLEHEEFKVVKQEHDKLMREMAEFQRRMDAMFPSAAGKGQI